MRDELTAEIEELKERLKEAEDAERAYERRSEGTLEEIYERRSSLADESRSINNELRAAEIKLNSLEFDDPVNSVEDLQKRLAEATKAAQQAIDVIEKLAPLTGPLDTTSICLSGGHYYIGGWAGRDAWGPQENDDRFLPGEWYRSYSTDPIR